jgi:uncharacterized damage-inducible protein DinB
MRADDIRFIFGYDRWASGRILVSARGVDDFDWSDPNRIDRRGLGGILVHALGAHERWRAGWEGGAIVHRREHDPLPPIAELAAAWEDEWGHLDGFLGGLTDADLDLAFEDVPLWQTMLHVVNHGTQHRSEAAALLTSLGRSPGDLDVVSYVELIRRDATG